MKRSLAFLIACAAAASGCSRAIGPKVNTSITEERKYKEGKYETGLEPVTSGSLWPENGRGLFADFRAYRVGDLVTVRLDESSKAAGDSSTQLDRESNESMGVPNFFGLTTALAFLPTLSLIGFFVLGATPTVMVLMTFQVLRRSSEFAIARPSREVLFTSAARQDRYKAKNFIDTFVYRTGDQVGAWFYTALTALGLGVSGTSGVGAAVSGIAIAVAIWLGWRHHRMPPT